MSEREESMIEHLLNSDTDIVVNKELYKKLQSQLKKAEAIIYKLEDCVADCVETLRAYDNLDLGLCNMKGVRTLNDPQIIHHEIIEVCLKSKKARQYFKDKKSP
jgi:uncharacterized protein YunC (DUF1805 family)